EPERERDLIRAEHDRALADLETGKRLVAELQWQLPQASANECAPPPRVQQREVDPEVLLPGPHRAVAQRAPTRRPAWAPGGGRGRPGGCERRGAPAPPRRGGGLARGAGRPGVAAVAGGRRAKPSGRAG